MEVELGLNENVSQWRRGESSNDVTYTSIFLIHLLLEETHVLFQ